MTIVALIGVGLLVVLWHLLGEIIDELGRIRKELERRR